MAVENLDIILKIFQIEMQMAILWKSSQQCAGDNQANSGRKKDTTQ